MKRPQRLVLGTLSVATLALLVYGAVSEQRRQPASAGPTASASKNGASVAPPAPPAASHETPPSHTVSADDLLKRACGSSSGSPSCECTKRAVLSGFDVRAPAAALDILSNSEQVCDKSALLGLEAEGLARNRQNAEALEQAERVFASDAKNPYAAYADLAVAVGLEHRAVAALLRGTS
jgi:hypothetical protein